MSETLLFKCLYKGNYEAVKEMILHKRVDVDVTDGFGQTPLFHAVYDHPELIDFFIKNGADVNVTNKAGLSVLVWALFNRPACVRQLLAAGADVNAPMFNNLPLLSTVFVHAPDLVEPFLDAGVRLDTKDENGLTPLHMAICCPEKIPLLVRYGADLEARDNQGRTPLYFAVGYGQKVPVQSLLDAGADVNAPNNEGKNPLLLALTLGQRSDASIISLLLERGADVNARDSDWHRPLMMAAYNAPHMIPELLKRGARVDERNRDGLCAASLLLASETVSNADKVKYMKVLLAHHADVYTRTDVGSSLMHFAVDCDSPELVDLLIKAGAPVDMLNDKRLTPMCKATNAGLKHSVEMARLLAAAGAKVVARAPDAPAPLEGAIFQQNTPMVKALLDAGVPVLDAEDKLRLISLGVKCKNPKIQGLLVLAALNQMTHKVVQIGRQIGQFIAGTDGNHRAR